MSLNPMKWKAKTLAYGILGIFSLYFLFIYKWSHSLRYEDTVKNTDPEHVWEYVADFSNMVKLNPTIEEFKVLHESGNYDHWKYTVQYTEHLSYIPSIRNVAHGNFSVIPKPVGYVIESTHRTCFSTRLLNCLDSTSEFTFMPDGDDTKCTENIVYECPLIFSYLCRKEALYQREEIMKNLKSYFLTAKKRKKGESDWNLYLSRD